MFIEEYATLGEKIKERSEHSYLIFMDQNTLQSFQMSILLKMSYLQPQWNLQWLPKYIFMEMEKAIINWPWNHKTSETAKAILVRLNQARGFITPNFKIYCPARLQQIKQYTTVICFSLTKVPITQNGENVICLTNSVGKLTFTRKSRNWDLTFEQ